MIWELLSAFGTVFLFLSAFLICTVILCRLIVSDAKDCFYTVIPGFENDERLAQKVFAVYVQTNLLAICKRSRLIVLDFGVSEDIKRECSEILGGHEVLFLSKEDLGELVGGGY
ncbi:MAG: hypothetical protein ACI4XE_09755 [Acutalibacteraceae bacterium]